MNKMHFNSKIDFACYCPNAKFKMVFLFSEKVQKRCRAVVVSTFVQTASLLCGHENTTYLSFSKL